MRYIQPSLDFVHAHLYGAIETCSLCPLALLSSILFAVPNVNVGYLETRLGEAS